MAMPYVTCCPSSRIARDPKIKEFEAEQHILNVLLVA